MAAELRPAPCRLPFTGSSNNLNFADACVATDVPMEGYILTGDADTIVNSSQLIGEWLPFDKCAEDDVIKVMQPFLDHNRAFQIRLETSFIGKVVAVDMDGDAEVVFPHLPGSRVVIKSNFEKMAKHHQPHPESAYPAQSGPTCSDLEENSENETHCWTAAPGGKEMHGT